MPDTCSINELVPTAAVNSATLESVGTTSHMQVDNPHIDETSTLNFDSDGDGTSDIQEVYDRMSSARRTRTSSAADAQTLVTLDVSLQDTIPSGNEISEFLLSDNFKDAFELHTLFSSDIYFSWFAYYFETVRAPGGTWPAPPASMVGRPTFGSTIDGVVNSKLRKVLWNVIYEAIIDVKAAPSTLGAVAKRVFGWYVQWNAGYMIEEHVDLSTAELPSLGADFSEVHLDAHQHIFNYSSYLYVLSYLFCRMDFSKISVLTLSDLATGATGDMSETEETFGGRAVRDGHPIRGATGFDSNGDYVYDLKIEPLQYHASPQDSYVCFYMQPMFDIQKAMTARGTVVAAATMASISIDKYSPDYCDLYFGDMTKMDILSNNEIVDNRVQDFRLVDRIADFISPQYSTAYSNKLSLITSATNNDNYLESDYMSKLYSSYEKQGTQFNTKNIFYLNLKRMFSRKSRYSSLYELLYYGQTTMPFREEIQGIIEERARISDMKVYRYRVDDNGNKFFRNDTPDIIAFSGEAGDSFILKTHVNDVSTGTSLEMGKIGEIGTSFSCMRSFGFVDNSIARKTHGKYRYEVKYTITDPMHDYIGARLHEVRFLLKEMKLIKAYINNSKKYDYLRNETSSFNLAEVASASFELYDGLTPLFINGWQKLFSLFTGYDFETIAPSFVDIEEIATNYVKLGMMINMAESFVFNIASVYSNSNYAAVSQANNQYGSDGSTPSGRAAGGNKALEETKYFSTVVDANIGDSSLYSMIDMSDAGEFPYVTRANYSDRMFNELVKFSPSISMSEATESRNLSCMSPDKLLTSLNTAGDNSFDLYGVNANGDQSIALDMELLLAILKNVLDVSEYSELERGLLLPTEYEISVPIEEARENTGVFESFLSSQGVTVSHFKSTGIEVDEVIGTANIPNAQAPAGNQIPTAGMPTLSRDLSFDILQEQTAVFVLSIDSGANQTAEAANTEIAANYTFFDDGSIIDSTRVIFTSPVDTADLIAQRRQKEDFLSRFLANRGGYSIFDKDTYIQGNRDATKYSLSKLQVGRDITAPTLASSGATTTVGQEYSRRGIHIPSILATAIGVNVASQAQSKTFMSAMKNRIWLTNLYNVYYLSGFDDNMNPVWLLLNNYDTVIPLEASSASPLLCKLELFRSDEMSIYESRALSLPITSKYFHISTGSSVFLSGVDYTHVEDLILSKLPTTGNR